MPKKSKRAKRADQKTISIAEVKNNPRLVEFLKMDIRNLAISVRESFSANGKGWARLRESAKRKDLTPVQYFCKYIAPKL